MRGSSVAASLIAVALIPAPAAAAPRGALAPMLTRAEWRRAENRRDCPPIVFTSSAGRPANARRAIFSGGWAVAFDTARVRSAYGVAGPSLTPIDRGSAVAQRTRLSRQWPYVMRLPGLPPPAFAGFGLAGAAPYPAEDPESSGRQSLAYVRIGGARCTYNVWSRLGRSHLERLLRSLRPL